MHHLSIRAECRPLMLLLDWLIQKYPTAKRTTLKRWAEDGRVRVNGQVIKKLKKELNESDAVTVIEGGDAPAPPRPGAGREDAKRAAWAAPLKHALRVVYEDGDVLVADKPHGLLTSTVPQEPRPTLLAQVREHVAAHDPAARVGLIHRLDKDAAGLLVFSKNHAAYESLKRQFFDHTVDRVYTAVVKGSPAHKRHHIKSRLVETNDGRVHSTKHEGKGQVASTEYQVLLEGNGRALLRVVLHTGRKHQIRVHLSELGHPIVNDVEYNPASRGRRRKGALMLVATSLAFEHPRTRQRVTFEIPIPQQMKAAVEA